MVRDRRRSSRTRRQDELSFDNALSSARRGDSDGFTALYRSLDRELFGFARARGAVDPEGVVNETFLRVFRSLETFEGNEAEFRSWVFAIGRNLLIDDARKQERRPRADTPLDQAPVVPARTDVEFDVVARGQEEEVVDLLGTLTADQRDVVALRVLADLPLREVAEMLDKPVGAVKSLQHRALSSLSREILSRGIPRGAVSAGHDRTLS